MQSPERPKPVAAMLAIVCVSLPCACARSFTWPDVPASFQKKSNAVRSISSQQLVVRTWVRDRRSLRKSPLFFRPPDEREDRKACDSQHRSAQQVPPGKLCLRPHESVTVAFLSYEMMTVRLLLNIL